MKDHIIRAGGGDSLQTLRVLMHCIEERIDARLGHDEVGPYITIAESDLDKFSDFC